MRAAALLLAAALAVVVLPAAARPPEAAEDSPELREVPRPALGNLEEADRLQLEEARQDLDALLAAGGVEPARLARAFGELGSLYVLYDLVEPAEAALGNAAALAPEEFTWHYYLGILAEREGRLEDARERFARAAALRSRDVPTLVRRARAELGSGLLEEAAESFRAVLDLDTGNAAALVGLGEIAYQEGRVEEAIERYLQALELQPEASSVHHRLGLAYRRAGDLEKAREHLAQNRGEPVRFADPLVDGLARFLQGSAIHFTRGNQAMTRGDVEAAIREYGKAADLDPDDPLIHYNLGLALVDAGRREEGIERFQRALKLDPDLRDVHYNLATALTEAGRLAEAAHHFERAWRIDPLDRSARLDWALALDRAGDREAAIRELDALVESLAGEASPVAGRAHLRLAALLEERSRSQGAAGEVGPALEHYRAAARLLPEDETARAGLAAALGRDGDLEAAAAEYAAAARLDPAEPGHRFGRAMALVLTGRHDEAREALDTALVEIERERPGEGATVPLAHLLARLLATSPDPAVRDGSRALELAGRVMEQAPAMDHAETLAMALAEAGDFPGAVEWQRRVLARAEAQGAPAPVLETIRARLARYERGEPERSPWEGS